MLNLFADFKNMIIGFLLIACISLYGAFLVEQSATKKAQSQRDIYKAVVDAQDQQLATYKKEGDEEVKKLKKAQENSKVFSIRSQRESNELLLEKVSPDCIEASAWMLDQALKFQKETP